MSVDLSKLQKAVGLTLANHAPLVAILGNRKGVIQGGTDRVVTPPYIVLGDDDMVDTSTDCFSAGRVTFPIKVYTAEDGFRQNKQISAAIAGALDDVAFPVEGHAVTGCYLMRARFFRDPEAGIRQGVNEFQIDIEATA